MKLSDFGLCKPIDQKAWGGACLSHYFSTFKVQLEHLCFTFEGNHHSTTTQLSYTPPL